MLAMLKLIPLRAWLYVALAAGMLVGYAYWHHHVYAQGVASEQAKLATLQAKFDTLTADYGQCGTALNDANAQAAQTKADTEAQMKRAAQLIQQLGQAAVQAQTDLADARAKLSEAAKSPNCATTASLKLCSAMQNY